MGFTLTDNWPIIVPPKQNRRKNYDFFATNNKIIYMDIGDFEIGYDWIHTQNGFDIFHY